MYVYAPTGERVLKSNAKDDTTTAFMYDGADVVADYDVPSDGNYSLQRSYVQGLGIDSKFAQIDSRGNAVFFNNDALGSVHQILNTPAPGADAVLLDTQLTTAWGEKIEGPSQLTRYGFTQRERDDENNLIFMRSRQYLTFIGRFSQVDSAQIYLSYLYCNNNPVIMTDPLGLWPVPEHIHFTNDEIETFLNSIPEVLSMSMYFKDRTINTIEDIVDRGNGSTDHILANFLSHDEYHCNSPSYSKRGIYMELFQKHLSDQEALFDRNVSKGGTQEAIDALKILGLILHSRQDFYRHAAPGDDKIENPKNPALWTLFSLNSISENVDIFTYCDNPSPDNPKGTHPSSYNLFGFVAAQYEKGEHPAGGDPPLTNIEDIYRKNLSIIDTRIVVMNYMAKWYNKYKSSILTMANYWDNLPFSRK